MPQMISTFTNMHLLFHHKAACITWDKVHCVTHCSVFHPEFIGLVSVLWPASAAKDSGPVIISAEVIENHTTYFAASASPKCRLIWCKAILLLYRPPSACCMPLICLCSVIHYVLLSLASKMHKEEKLLILLSYFCSSSTTGFFAL